jgi:hypothetical protein
MSQPIFTLNLTDGARLSRTYDGLTLYERGTIVGTLRGLTDGSSNESQTALGRALNAVQAKYPTYASIPGITTVGVVTGQEVLGMAQSDDAVNFSITIDTPTQSYTPTYIVSDTTSVQPGKTQILRQGGSIIQLQIPYTVPAGPGQIGIIVGLGQGNLVANLQKAGMTKQFVPTIDYDECIRRIVFNAVLVAGNFDQLRTDVRTVNSQPCYGLSTGFWKLDVFHTETKDRGRTYSIQAEISASVDHDWSKYAVLKDRNTGQYVTCDQNDLNTAEGLGYQWGYIYGGPNGAGGGQGKPFIRVGPYVTSNFQQIFNTLNPQGAPQGSIGGGNRAS